MPNTLIYNKLKAELFGNICKFLYLYGVKLADIVYETYTNSPRSNLAIFIF